MVSRFTTAHSSEHYYRAPEFRVFIASTFHDMEREREYLVKHLFPELRRLSRARGVDFTESGPRWREGCGETYRREIVGASLEETIRDRPFFIGIVGPCDGDAADAEEMEEKSLIAIEIAEEALKNLTMEDNAIFYVREPASGARGEWQGRSGERLKALLKRIDQCGIPIRGPFAAPEALAEALRNDLRDALDRRHPAGDMLPVIIQERRLNEAFAATRRSVYVEDPAMIALLDAHAEGSLGPLVITGDSGAGKSALLAYWSHRYRMLHRNAFVVEHYVDGSSTSDHLSILRRVMAEIKIRYGLADPLPASPEEIESSALAWLARVQQERLVLVIDALDRLDPASQHLAWLPDYIQPHVHLITSSLPGVALETIRERGWTECAIMPLSDEERDAVVRRFLTSNGNPFDQDEIQRFVAGSAGSNPLAILTGLKELIATDAGKKSNEWIDDYLNAGEPDRLYQRVLEHREKVFGRGPVRDVMVAIWASRRGLDREELVEIHPRHRGVIPDLLASLDYSLMDRGGLLTFFHDYLRQVVETRYLADHRKRSDAHHRLARYFGRRPFGARMLDELLWQLEMTGDSKRLLEWIGRLDVLIDLCMAGKELELLRYWRSVGEKEDMAKIYREGLDRLEAKRNAEVERGDAGTERDVERGDGVSRIMVHIETARFLLHAGKVDAAEEILQQTLADPEMVKDESVLGRVRILNMLGVLYQSRGVFPSADRMFNRAWSICRDYLGETDPESVRTLHLLATQHYRKGNLDGAIKTLEHVVTLRRRHGASNRHELASALNDLGAVWFKKENLPKAEALVRESLRIRQEICGAEHPDRLEALNNLGAIVQSNGDLEQAERIYRDVLLISDRAFGPSNSMTALYLNNLAHLLKSCGRLKEAESLYLRALEIDRKNFGNLHPRVANLLVNIGALYRALRNYHEAEHMMKEALVIRSVLFGADHVDTARAGVNLASLFKAWRHYEESKSYYEKYIELSAEHLGTEHSFVAGGLRAYTEVLDIMGCADQASRVRAAYPVLFAAS